MTLLLGDADVRDVADMARCIDSVEAALREQAAGRAVMPPRLNLADDDTFLRLMPVILPGLGLLGYKSFHGSMAAGVRYLVVLCRMADGEVLALVDAPYLTALRTGATSGVATKYLAPPGPVSVGVIGSGLEADTNLAAVAAVREVREVKVFSPRPERREAFAARVTAEHGIVAKAVEDPRRCTEDAEVVIVATNTGPGGPVAYEGDWMVPGQHVISIGATSPFLRELDPVAFTRPEHVVLDVPIDHMADESGDVAILPEPVRDELGAGPSLAEVVARGSFDRKPRDITLFKSVGTAAQDVAAAHAVYEAATRRDVGTSVPPVAGLKVF